MLIVQVCKAFLEQFFGMLSRRAGLLATCGFSCIHWLPVRQRVNYKIVTLVHRCLSGHLSYLADDCRLVTDAGVRRLRSADTRTLVVGRTQSSFGNRTFAAAAPNSALEQFAV